MADEKTCPHCGKLVPPSTLGGICPECMLKAGLATQTEGPGATGPHGTKVVPPLPKPEEIAPLFPQLDILECLGRGGMGVVYKARQPRLNRLVALKILAREKEQDAQFTERFTREAQALARLSHPNIVTVHDFGEAGGHCYLVMEFVDGLNLRQVLQAGKVKPEQALAIVPKICEALQYAHEQGIVHRDIKPENILLDKQGRVKIADFGIVKMVGGGGALPRVQADQQVSPTNLTEAGHTVGTPRYMAPEQVEHPQTVDHRADIYSLGVVFYEMLTGELPLEKFQPPSKKVQIDVRLDEVVLHALEKEPERRYQQASVLKTQVETIAQTSPAEIRNLKPETAPRFPPTAIIGALLIPVFFFSTVFWNFGHLGGLQALVGTIMSTIGFVSIVTTTVLGWVAVAQIRRSGGRLYGLWLALLDGLVLPGLALNAVLIFGLLLINKFANVWLLVWWYPVLEEHAFLNNKHFAIWLLFATAAIIGSNYAVIRGIWRALNKSADGSMKSAGFGWRTPLAIVAAIVMLLVIAAGVAFHFHPERPFYIGQTSFPQGDYIEIASVERSTNQMVVKGYYSLVSHDQATLALYITTKNNIVVPSDLSQSMQISKGRGDFTLIRRHLVSGLPHVSMYANGHPFASVYFGTKAEALEESKASWITNQTTSNGGSHGGGIGSSKAPEFGPTHEVILPALDNRTGILLDLDTGAWATNTEFGANDRETHAWIRSNRVDVLGVIERGQIGILSMDMAVVPAPSNGWDSISAEAVLINWGLNQQEPHKITPLLTVLDHTDTWLFRTREDRHGVLQILGQSKHPTGVKIRYKLVREPNTNSSPAKVMLERKGLAVISLSNELWQASVTFRNHGRTTSPAFHILFYAGPPQQNGRLISRNTAGPIDPGQTFCEATPPFVLRHSETEIYAVVDPENSLPRPAKAIEWILKASAVAHQGSRPKKMRSTIKT